MEGLGDKLNLEPLCKRLIFFAVFIGMIPIFFPNVFAMVCTEQSDSSFELILDCVDTIDVQKNTLKGMYEDLENFSNSFEGAKVYDIRFEDSITFATMEIPLPLVNSLKSDIKFTTSSIYSLEFLNGKLGGSSLLISVNEIDGYDGTKNGGSEVSFTFQIKKIPCFAFGLKCGTSNDFEYALDRGLYLVELKTKEIQKTINDYDDLQINSNTEKGKQETQSNPNNNNFIQSVNYPRSDHGIDLNYLEIQKITKLKPKNELTDGFGEIQEPFVLENRIVDKYNENWEFSKLKNYQVDTTSKKTCKLGFELLFKPNTEDPACVLPSSAEKLVQRGWTKGYP